MAETYRLFEIHGKKDGRIVNRAIPEPAADEPLALEAFEDEAFTTEAFDTDAFDLEADEPNTVSPEPENAGYHHPVAEAEPQLEEPAGEPELVLGLSPQVATGFAGDIQL